MTRWLLTSTSRSFADFATTIDAPFIPLPVPAAAMQQRGLFPNSNPYQIIMFDLHKETVDVLTHFFEWYHISYSDDYTRWGKKHSYTCLAFCTDRSFYSLVKMLLDFIADYCDTPEQRDVVSLDVAKLLRVLETTGYDPDNIFPGKSQYHTIYYFPEIHMEV